MNRILSLLLLLLSQQAFAQSLKEKLASAIAELAADSQMRHAIIGFSVCDVKTGAAVYEQNAETGLAPASTQKLFTSCAAFDLLGKDYTYTTSISYSYVKGFPGRGYFSIDACGDPSLGSLRFQGTRADRVLDTIVSAVHRQKLTKVSLRGQLIHSFDNSIPGGWIWEDIGN
jgi:D-alanyl-D-alanine carboxypeptidase/D-alanyl-D-alanine-endopeptidase (penicillin-binding protein 4)